MQGKLVLCAVLCLFFNQVCLAEQPTNRDAGSSSLRVSSCRRSLRQIAYTISILSYDFALLYVELLASAIELIKCALSSNVSQCGQNALGDTVDGIREAVVDFAKNIGVLGNNLGDGINYCLLQKNVFASVPFLNEIGKRLLS